MQSTGVGSKKVLITGWNKGIGYGILKNLAKRPEKHTFIMAVRNVELGKKALEELSKEIPDIKSRTDIVELDITKTDSIDKAIKHIESKNLNFDCLFNNAGTDSKSDKFNIDVVNATLKTNFYGTIEVTEKFLPLIKNNGKVIITGSILGHSSMVKA